MADEEDFTTLPNAATPPINGGISAVGGWDAFFQNAVGYGLTKYFDTQSAKSLARSNPQPVLVGESGVPYEAGRSSMQSTGTGNFFEKNKWLIVGGVALVVAVVLLKD